MQISVNPQPRQYECTCLVGVGYTDSELKAITQEILDLIKKHQGQSLKMTEWGKRDLAYLIKKGGKRHTEAHYFHITFEALPSQVGELEKTIHQLDKVIRHLLVLASDDVVVAAPAKVEEAQA